jgi:hypothetical protein
MEQMLAAQKLIQFADERGHKLSMRPDTTNPTLLQVSVDDTLVPEPKTPITLWQERETLFPPMFPAVGTTPLPPPNFEEDPPHAVEQKRQEIAEEIAEAGGEEPAERAPTSVVKLKYRAIYKEEGHPSNCGDELAEKLNNLVKNSKGTDMELFKLIMDANEIDMSKYRTSGLGWQGRYRMTGRIKLAKKLATTDGVMKLPPWVHEGEMRMSGDWIAAQKFRK